MFTIEILVAESPYATTVTLSTGGGDGVMESVSVPDRPLLVAVIVVVPDVNPVARPSRLTEAPAGLLDSHVIGGQPARGAALATVGVAVNCNAFPTITVGAPTALTTTLATAGGENNGVFTRSAVLNATLNRAICCASMTFPTPSSFTSPHTPLGATPASRARHCNALSTLLTRAWRR